MAPRARSRCDACLRIGLASADDAAIARHAEVDGAVLVTKDENFVSLRLPDRFALPWLRCGNTTRRALLLWIDERWDEIERLLTAGERFVEVQ